MADIGTPENPEIIEPGQRPSSAQARPTLPSRWAIASQILRILFAITLPAVGVDMVFAWAFNMALNQGGVVPLLLIMLFIFPALILTFVALVANAALWPALILVLLGKTTANPLSDQRFARFKIVTTGRR